MIMKRKIQNLIAENKILIVLILIVIIITIIDGRFIRPTNLVNVLLHASINGIMALGMTTLIISGNFDLSIGSTLSVAGMIAIILQPEFGLVIPMIIAIIAGCLIGLINGVIVTYGKVNAFIATLATMIIIKGLALSMNHEAPVPNTIPAFNEIGSGKIGIIPYPVLYFIGLVIIFWLFMGHTTFGRNAYAIGGNELSAKLSGINVNLYKIMYFVLSGFCAALAGVVLASRLNTGSPVFGDPTPLIVISAVVLGGTVLSGGIGTIKGTIFGVLVLGVINTGMDLLNVQSYYQFVVRGSILVIVILVEAYYVRMKELGRITG